MALPQPPAPILTASNPLEGFISSFNTNSYFIGIMMLILNLAGRHIATGLTPDQDKFFQNIWFRRFLLFVVIFVATRNIFAAFWLSIAVIVTLGFLTNETSSLYLFGDPIKPPPQPPQPLGLSPEESDIYKRLHERVTKTNVKPNEESLNNTDSFIADYISTMQNIRAPSS